MSTTKMSAAASENEILDQFLVRLEELAFKDDGVQQQHAAAPVACNGGSTANATRCTFSHADALTNEAENQIQCQLYTSLQEIVRGFIYNNEIDNIVRLQGMCAVIKLSAYLTRHHNCSSGIPSNRFARFLACEVTTILLNADICQMAEASDMCSTWSMFLATVRQVYEDNNCHKDHSWLSVIQVLLKHSWNNPILVEMTTSKRVQRRPSETQLQFLETEGSNLLQLRLIHLLDAERYQDVIYLADWCALMPLMQIDRFFRAVQLLALHLMKSESFSNQCKEMSCSMACEILDSLETNMAFASRYRSAILCLAMIFLVCDLQKSLQQQHNNINNISCSQHWLKLARLQHPDPSSFQNEMQTVIFHIHENGRLIIFLNTVISMYGEEFLELCTHTARTALRSERNRLLRARLYVKDIKDADGASKCIVIIIDIICRLYRNHAHMHNACLLTNLYINPSNERYKALEMCYLENKLPESPAIERGDDGSSDRFARMTIPPLVNPSLYTELHELIETLRPLNMKATLSWDAMHKLICHIFSKKRWMFVSEENIFKRKGGARCLGRLSELRNGVVNNCLNTISKIKGEHDAAAQITNVSQNKMQPIACSGLETSKQKLSTTDDLQLSSPAAVVSGDYRTTVVNEIEGIDVLFGSTKAGSDSASSISIDSTIQQRQQSTINMVARGRLEMIQPKKHCKKVTLASNETAREHDTNKMVYALKSSTAANKYTVDSQKCPICGHVFNLTSVLLLHVVRIHRVLKCSEMYKAIKTCSLLGRPIDIYLSGRTVLSTSMNLARTSDETNIVPAHSDSQRRVLENAHESQDFQNAPAEVHQSASNAEVNQSSPDRDKGERVRSLMKIRTFSNSRNGTNGGYESGVVGTNNGKRNGSLENGASGLPLIKCNVEVDRPPKIERVGLYESLPHHKTEDCGAEILNTVAHTSFSNGAPMARDCRVVIERLPGTSSSSKNNWEQLKIVEQFEGTSPPPLRHYYSSSPRSQCSSPPTLHRSSGNDTANQMNYTYDGVGAQFVCTQHPSSSEEHQPLTNQMSRINDGVHMQLGCLQNQSTSEEPGLPDVGQLPGNFISFAKYSPFAVDYNSVDCLPSRSESFDAYSLPGEICQTFPLPIADTDIINSDLSEALPAVVSSPSSCLESGINKPTGTVPDVAMNSCGYPVDTLLPSIVNNNENITDNDKPPDVSLYNVAKSPTEIQKTVMSFQDESIIKKINAESFSQAASCQQEETETCPVSTENASMREKTVRTSKKNQRFTNLPDRNKKYVISVEQKPNTDRAESIQRVKGIALSVANYSGLNSDHTMARCDSTCSMDVAAHNSSASLQKVCHVMLRRLSAPELTIQIGPSSNLEQKSNAANETLEKSCVQSECNFFALVDRAVHGIPCVKLHRLASSLQTIQVPDLQSVSASVSASTPSDPQNFTDSESGYFSVLLSTEMQRSEVPLITVTDKIICSPAEPHNASCITEQHLQYRSTAEDHVTVQDQVTNNSQNEQSMQSGRMEEMPYPSTSRGSIRRASKTCITCVASHLSSLSSAPQTMDRFQARQRGNIIACTTAMMESIGDSSDSDTDQDYSSSAKKSRLKSGADTDEDWSPSTPSIRQKPRLKSLRTAALGSLIEPFIPRPFTSALQNVKHSGVVLHSQPVTSPKLNSKVTIGKGKIISRAGVSCATVPIKTQSGVETKEFSTYGYKVSVNQKRSVHHHRDVRSHTAASALTSAGTKQSKKSPVDIRPTCPHCRFQTWSNIVFRQHVKQCREQVICISDGDDDDNHNSKPARGNQFQKPSTLTVLSAIATTTQRQPYSRLIGIQSNKVRSVGVHRICGNKSVDNKEGFAIDSVVEARRVVPMKRDEKVDGKNMVDLQREPARAVGENVEDVKAVPVMSDSNQAIPSLSRESNNRNVMPWDNKPMAHGEKIKGGGQGNRFFQLATEIETKKSIINSDSPEAGVWENIAFDKCNTRGDDENIITTSVDVESVNVERGKEMQVVNTLLLDADELKPLEEEEDGGQEQESENVDDNTFEGHQLCESQAGHEINIMRNEQEANLWADEPYEYEEFPEF